MSIRSGLLTIVVLVGRRFCLSVGQLHKSIEFYYQVWQCSRVGPTRRRTRVIEPYSTGIYIDTSFDNVTVVVHQ
jgi:hypothetical protein